MIVDADRIQTLKRPFVLFFKKKLPCFYHPHLDDAFSSSVLHLLEEPETLPENPLQDDSEGELLGLLVKNGWTYLNGMHEESVQKERMRKGLLPKHKRLDYNKLDPRFKNSLTKKQMKIWELRCNFTRCRSICSGLNITPVDLMVTEYYMRRKYGKWLKTIVALESIPKSKKLNIIQRRVLTEYLQGYMGQTVAKKLNRPRGHICTVLSQLKQWGVQKAMDKKIKKIISNNLLI
jgi:hypothetical protein